MGARVTIVMSVFNQLGLTRSCLESLRRTTEPFRLVVIDNGSTDETPQFFERFEYPYPLRFERHLENRSVIVTLNRAWRLADTEDVCILHNDTERVEPEWLGRRLAALKYFSRFGAANMKLVFRRMAGGVASVEVPV